MVVYKVGKMLANMSIFHASGISGKCRQILENTGRLNFPPWNLYNNLHSKFIRVISVINSCQLTFYLY